jgi:hypothetical protein
MSPPNLRQTFRPLGRIGEWVQLADGQRGWRPDGVAADWQPYRVGHWAWTSDGWFWVSEEPWAWATYHHGRWRFSSRHGWVWLPGATWEPARVVWRFAPGVVGWAPLTDDGLVLPSHWTFLPTSRFTGVPVGRAAIAAARVPRLLAASRVAAASAGPLPSRSNPTAVELPSAPRPRREPAPRHLEERRELDEPRDRELPSVLIAEKVPPYVRGPVARN